MPVIREYVSRGTPQGGVAARPLSGADLAPSGALADLGRTLVSVSTHYEQTRRETLAARTAAQATQNLRDYTFTLANGSQDAEGNFTQAPDPIEHPARFQAKVKEINDGARQALGDDQLFEKFQGHFAPQVAASMLDMQKVSLDRQRDQVDADVMEAEDALAQSLVMAGSAAGEDAAQAAAGTQMQAVYDRMVLAGVLTPEAAYKRREDFDKKVSTAFVIRDIRNDPEAAMAALLDGQAYAGLPVEQRERWATVAQRQIDARARAEEAKLNVTDRDGYGYLVGRAMAGEDVSAEAIQLYRAGQLKEASLGKILAEVDQHAQQTPPLLKRGEEYIRGLAGTFDDMAVRVRLADALDTWRDWYDAHPKASLEEGQKAYKQLASDALLANVQETAIGLLAPSYLVGSRAEPDIGATLRATEAARDTGEIDEWEFRRQSRLLEQWQHLEDQKAAAQ